MAINDSSSYERDVAAIVQKAEESLVTILDESGTILYSSHETLKPGKYYFLGLNPGGVNAGTDTIRQSLGNLGVLSENAYLDQDWGSNLRSTGKGCHRLQKNFKCLFEALGEDPRTVCASNLIFKRSTDARGAGYPAMAKLCWPVHEVILRVVRPRAIIAFGVTDTFQFVTEQLGGGPVQYSKSGHGDWAWGSLIKEGAPSIIGLPHLSRYTLWTHLEVVEQIRSLLMVESSPQIL
jgi:hypothetical protein